LPPNALSMVSFTKVYNLYTGRVVNIQGDPSISALGRIHF
jgi:hypothetical protein